MKKKPLKLISSSWPMIESLFVIFVTWMGLLNSCAKHTVLFDDFIVIDKVTLADSTTQTDTLCYIWEKTNLCAGDGSCLPVIRAKPVIQKHRIHIYYEIGYYKNDPGNIIIREQTDIISIPKKCSRVPKIEVPEPR